MWMPKVLEHSVNQSTASTYRSPLQGFTFVLGIASRVVPDDEPLLILTAATVILLARTRVPSTSKLQPSKIFEHWNRQIHELSIQPVIVLA